MNMNMKKEKVFRTISGIALVSGFIFAGKVLFDIYDFGNYDSSQVLKDLLWAIGCGSLIILVIPTIRKRYSEKKGDNRTQCS
jgi:membrane protein DedA with SNARE-associated domain